jgi:monoamine oxidase
MNTITYSTLVIGAGAAGIASARLLADAGYKPLILEARNRIGGRIHTDTIFADFPLELGAEFVHGDQTITHELVKQANLTTIPVVRMDNLWWADGEMLARPHHLLAPELQERIAHLLEDYYQLAETSLAEDISLAQYLQSLGYESLDMADVLLAQTCCASIESLSCYDLIREMQVDHAGHGEARIIEGYTALLNWYARDLDVRFNQYVTEIQSGGEGVTVICDGKQYAAQTCIITVPVSVLQQRIRFIPQLPDDKRQAINDFCIEPATKLIYRFREQFWSDDLTFMAHERLTARWWTPGYRRDSTPVLATYVTANRARQLDVMSEAEALAIGLEELSMLLGMPLLEIKEQCIAAKRVSWANDPYTLGGYAHVPSGKSDCRPLLARPEGNMLFFAGEATAYDSNPQTVHGAIESGWRAAKECLVVLRK